MKRYSILILMIFLLSSVAFSQDKIKVACIGNSVTYGYGHENPEVTSYPSQLATMLGDDYEVGNFGKSGATLLRKGHRPYNEQEEYKKALEFAPDIAIIHLGLNDTDPRNWKYYKREFISDYVSLIEDIEKVNPEVEIYICRMTPIFHWHHRFLKGTRDWYWEIQATIENIAENIAEVKLIDLQEILYHRPDLMPDALHPDPEGATLIARRVYSAITGDFGGLSVPQIYSDNMVIQRDEPFVVKGLANSGEEISVRLDKQKIKTKAGDDGKWEVTFSPLKADGKKHKLTITSEDKTLSFKNIVVGEVWLCSGQSNMAFMVRESSHKELSLSNLEGKDIRLYDMKARVITNDIEWDSADLVKINKHDYYLPTVWELQDENNVSDFSAIAYHFGVMLADSLQMPIGLICNAVGGAPAESFIDRKTLEWHPQLVNILYDFYNNEMIQDWCRGRASLNCAKSDNDLQRHPYNPAYLYETGIAPIASYPIKGVIWYQGESNAHNTELHETIFPTLVDSWRRTWNDEKMPFYFVQLSSIERSTWPQFRDSQRLLAEQIEHCDFAVSSDKGDRWNVHPTEKAVIGERLARLALKDTYNFEHVVSHGPTIEKAERRSNCIILTFSDANGMRSSDGEKLRTFELADESGIFHPADKIEIEGNCIIISSKEVTNPTQARYGWQPYSEGNLVNKEGLPASTFKISLDDAKGCRSNP
ncbi:MAG: sialate O-acetylesterase [Bacteroidales bacterium]|nr:sialate O-acetylesterase [Bacteroidales bacterium]